ncbi:MAG: hypothetical protein ACM3U1_04830 [Chloroflexota bacterium]
MLQWFKCKGQVWCDLFKLDLEHEYLQGFSGIYVLWVGDAPSRRVLRVGSGNIQKELQAVKKELAMQAFKHLGIRVSWAEISNIKRPGVELYFVQALNPAIITELPRAIPVKENLPWE